MAVGVGRGLRGPLALQMKCVRGRSTASQPARAWARREIDTCPPPPLSAAGFRKQNNFCSESVPLHC